MTVIREHEVISLNASDSAAFVEAVLERRAPGLARPATATKVA